MGHGIAKVDNVGQPAQVTVTDASFWDFLYTTSTVRHQRYNIGDRVVLPDGRVFRYAKAGAAIASTDLAVSFASAAKVSYETVRAASAISTREVYIDEASLTEDELRGGYLIVFKNGASTHCVRGIIGNTASDASDHVVIYLDASLPYALTTSDNVEVMSNPYSDVRQTNFGGLASFAGMPAKDAASGAYLWVQTWGPCWCAPQATVAAAAYVRSVYFRHDGSLDVRATIGTFVTDQCAGFVLDYSPSGQGPPLIMLQVSP